MQMFLFLILLPVFISNAFSCPKECSCENTDDKNHVIICSGTGWTRIKHKLSPKLERIDFTSNNITRLGQEFYGLTILSSLELQYNEISFFDTDTFKDLHNLVYLDLSFNQITNISVKTFINNKKLEKLYLKQNPIHFPRDTAWFSSQSITYLDISFCNKGGFIPSIAFTQVTKIETLMIEGFSFVSETTFSHLKRLKDIYVEKTPEDCNGKSLRDLLNVTDIKIHIANDNDTTDSLICIAGNEEKSGKLRKYTTETLSMPEIVISNVEVSTMENIWKVEPVIVKSSTLDTFTLIVGLVLSACIFVICVTTYLAYVQCNKRKSDKKERNKLPTPESMRKGQRLAEPEYDYPVLRPPEYLAIQDGPVCENGEEMELYLQPIRHQDPDIVSSSIPVQHCQNLEEVRPFIYSNVVENNQNCRIENYHLQQNRLRNFRNTGDSNNYMDQSGPSNMEDNNSERENNYIQHRRHRNIRGISHTLPQIRYKDDQNIKDANQYFQEKMHVEYLDMGGHRIKQIRPANDIEEGIYVQQSGQSGIRDFEEYRGCKQYSETSFQTTKAHALVHQSLPKNYQELRRKNTPVYNSKQEMYRGSYRTKPVYQKTTEPISNFSRRHY